MLAFFNRQDVLLYCASWTLMAASLVMIISIGGPIIVQQVVSVILALILMIFCAHINWRTLSSRPIVIGAIYLLSLLILALTSLFAPIIRNTRSWLVIGPVQFQVAELMKVALIIILAYYFARHHIGIAKLSNIARSFFYYLLPAIFIFLQPDMGTMIVLTGIWIGFLLVSGLRPKHILIGLGAGIVLIIVAWFFVFAPYQKERIIGFFQPDYDPLGVNYSTIQAKIAIGSGGFFGKGFRQGTQTQLGFLPEPETDFIFAALAEEWGLLGVVVVLTAFFTMLFKIVSIGMNAESNFYRLLCLGVAIMFLVQFIINVGSATGMLPVVGVTFPFFSYGGSSILMNAVLVGIVQSAKRFAHSPKIAPIHSSIF